MKNIITITSLLAAGTLAASAAVPTQLLWGFDFTSDNLAASTGTVENLTGSGTIDTTGGRFGTGSYTTTTDNSTKLSFTASGDTSSLAEGSGSFTLSFHAKYLSGSTSWPVLAAFGAATGYQWKLTRYANGGTMVLDRDGYTELSTKDLGAYTPSTDWAHYALTYNADKTFSLYINGNLLGTTSVANLTSSNPMKTFAFGGKLQNGNNSAVTFSDIAIYKGALASDQIKYLSANKANDSAIPEPSAFGLLAGLGALALVGARRRRKTK